MILVEAINSFVVIFLVSEIFILNNTFDTIFRKKYNIIILGVTFCLNILLSTWLPIRAVVLKSLFVVEYPFYYLFKYFFGVKIVVSTFSFLIVFGVQYVYEINKNKTGENHVINKTWKYYGKKCFKPFLCAIISFVVMSIHDHKGGDMYLKFIFNFCVVSVVFSLGAYYDVRREISSLSIDTFLSTVWDGIKWLLPVFPFLMVLCSTIFFIIICIFDFLHLKEYEHYLN